MHREYEEAYNQSKSHPALEEVEEFIQVELIQNTEEGSKKVKFESYRVRRNRCRNYDSWQE